MTGRKKAYSDSLAFDKKARQNRISLLSTNLTYS